MNNQRSPKIGDVIAGCRLIRVVGQGGMGVVYEALHLRLDRRVAVKVVAPHLADQSAFVQRFEREAKVAASISHPNVVAVYDAGVQGGFLYLVMAFVDGPNLAEVLRDRGPLAPARACRLISQIAAGLDAAHKRKLIHRDIKPANVLLAGRGAEEQAVITDFGLMRQAGTSSLTGTQSMVGTFPYVSPEQIEGRPLDSRADVYALGCVLFELLTGRVPFERDGIPALLHAHLHAECPPVSAAAGVSAAFDDVIATAMAKDPVNRYPTATAFAQAANAAARGRDTSAGGQQPDGPPPTRRAPRPQPAPTVVRPTAPPPPPRSRKPALIAVAVLLVLVVAGAGAAVALTSSDSSSDAAAKASTPAHVTATTADRPTVTTPAPPTTTVIEHIKTVTVENTVTTKATPPPGSSSDQTTFHAPTGNVSCAISSGGATCTVNSVMQTFVLTADGPATVHDGVRLGRSEGRLQNFGTTVTAGDVACEVPLANVPKGITCTNASTGHGFEASRIGSRQKTY